MGRLLTLFILVLNVHLLVFGSNTPTIENQSLTGRASLGRVKSRESQPPSVEALHGDVDPSSAPPSNSNSDEITGNELVKELGPVASSLSSSNSSSPSLNEEECELLDPKPAATTESIILDTVQNVDKDSHLEPLKRRNSVDGGNRKKAKSNSNPPCTRSVSKVPSNRNGIKKVLTPKEEEDSVVKNPDQKGEIIMEESTTHVNNRELGMDLSGAEEESFCSVMEEITLDWSASILSPPLKDENRAGKNHNTDTKKGPKRVKKKVKTDANTKGLDKDHSINSRPTNNEKDNVKGLIDRIEGLKVTEGNPSSSSTTKNKELPRTRRRRNVLGESTKKIQGGERVTRSRAGKLLRAKDRTVVRISELQLKDVEKLNQQANDLTSRKDKLSDLERIRLFRLITAISTYFTNNPSSPHPKNCSCQTHLRRNSKLPSSTTFKRTTLSPDPTNNRSPPPSTPKSALSTGPSEKPTAKGSTGTSSPPIIRQNEPTVLPPPQPIPRNLLNRALVYVFPFLDQLSAVTAYFILGFLMVATLGLVGLCVNIRIRRLEENAIRRLSLAHVHAATFPTTKSSSVVSRINNV